MHKRGVYFIANNRVLDLSIAFLNSFRKYNPIISLCLIPYDNNYDKILALQKVYRFDVFKNLTLLQECDAISVKFHNYVLGSFRKLAMWDGIFEEFIYIDVDTVVLDNIDFCFQYLDKYPCITSHSNIQQIRKFVWKDSIYNSDYLSEEQIAFAANTGFIVSKKGFFDMQWIKKNTDKALSVKEHMELFCQEQPFLNYLIVTSGKPYTSLLVLSSTIEKNSNIKLEFWAGQKGGKTVNGKFYFKNMNSYFLLHWAGEWQPREIDWILYRFLRFMRLIDKNRIPEYYIFMPYKNIWNYYRHLN
jgi:hypothetical protein